MTPTVTVVTPTVRGREALLAECRASVRVALPEAEHLVLCDDDGEGPAVVRNKAAQLAAADWLLFLDDDDTLLPHYLSIVEPELDTADVVYTAWHLTGATDPLPPEAHDDDALRRSNFIPVTAMVRATRFERLGGFRSDVPLEDHDLWLRLLDDGARFAYVPVTGWRYRRQPGSRTATEKDRTP